MQIKMFVIKPTDHNGFFFSFFLSAIPLALNAAAVYTCVRSVSGNTFDFARRKAREASAVCRLARQ